jgi:hypothetical protein
VATGGTLLICLALPRWQRCIIDSGLIAALFIFGAGLGTVDPRNLQAVIVERASGKNMMSGFHGLFSLGGIVGAAGVSGLLGLGISPLGATLVVIVILLIALAKARRICCPMAATARDRRLPFPTASCCSSARCVSSYFRGRRGPRLERGVPGPGAESTRPMPDWVTRRLP